MNFGAEKGRLVCGCIRYVFITAESDWTTQGITLCNTSQNPNQPDLGTFHSSYDVVFVDPSGYHNMSSHMLESTFHRVKIIDFLFVCPCQQQKGVILFWCRSCWHHGLNSSTLIS